MMIALLLRESHSVRGETAERKPLYKPGVRVLYTQTTHRFRDFTMVAQNRGPRRQDSGEIGYVSNLIGDDEIRASSISGQGRACGWPHSFLRRSPLKSDSRSSGGVITPAGPC